MWQVRHKTAGLFMGVSHGKGHFHLISQCCQRLGVFRFNNHEQILSLLRQASSPHLPEASRMYGPDFVVEPWDRVMHDFLIEEGLMADCYAYLMWSLNTYPNTYN